MLQEYEIKPVGLADQVRDAIEKRILTGALRPGDRIVEQRIAREFGVGQNAVREALIKLAHLGFVQRTPNKGTRVTKIGLTEARKIFEVRGVLEGLAVSLVAKRHEIEGLDLGQAESLAQAMVEAAQAGNLPAYHSYDIQFHRALWTLTDNEYLVHLLERLVIPLFASFLLVSMGNLSSREMFIEGAKHHLEVIQAIKKKSGKEASAALKRLLELTFEQRRIVLSRESEPEMDEHADAPEEQQSN